MKFCQLSVSIVVYKNDPEEVVAAIRSVLSSDLRVRCTVIDNSPTEDLRSSVLEVGCEYVHLGKNVGFGAAHNVALRKDRELSEYHLVLNPDVSFESKTLSILYEFMNDRTDIGLVMPRVLYPDGNEQRLCKKFPTPIDLVIRRFLGRLGRLLFSKQLRSYEMLDLNLGIAREVPCLSGCFMFIRCAALLEVGYFDERYFMYMEDVDLCRRIGERHKTVFFPGVSISHGYAKGSYRDYKLLRYHLQSAIKYFNKWGWFHDSMRASLNSRIYPLVSDQTADLPVSTHQHD
jgi:GT2 family glycosyltransferase